MKMTGQVRNFKQKPKTTSGEIAYLIPGENKITINFDLDNGKTINITLTYDEIELLEKTRRQEP